MKIALTCGILGLLLLVSTSVLSEADKQKLATEYLELSKAVKSWGQVLQ